MDSTWRLKSEISMRPVLIFMAGELGRF